MPQYDQPSDLYDLPGITVTRLRYKTRTETKRHIIHDSHTSPEVKQVKEVSRWHLQAHETALHMGLMSIGYHFIIERDGKIVKGRPVGQIGSHTPGHNMDSIGTCLVGGRDGDGDGEDNFTSEQRKALIGLHIKLEGTYGKLKVHGHSEIQKFRSRSLPPCPMLDMELLREDIRLAALGIIL